RSCPVARFAAQASAALGSLFAHCEARLFMKLLRALPDGRFLANSAAPCGSLVTHCQLMFWSACSLARPSGNCWIQPMADDISELARCEAICPIISVWVWLGGRERTNSAAAFGSELSNG